MNRDCTETATLLVVDDTEASIDVLVSFLQAYDPIACTSGADALELVAAESIDLVLLDIVMPDIDGLEVCRRMRSHTRTKDVPIIFITAKDDENTIELAYQAGGDDYVTKPVRKAELLSRVQTHLVRYDQFKQLRSKNVQLYEARQALLESDERHRLALEAARDGLWDWNIKADKVHFSPGWGRILGIEEVLDSFDEWKHRIHPEDAQSTLGSLTAHLDGHCDDWDCEHRVQHKEGFWVWVRGRGKVVRRDQQGQALRMVGTMNDIGERKRNDEILALRQKLADMVYSQDIHTIMRTALDAAEKITDSNIGFYHFVEGDQETVSMQVWSTRTLQDMCFSEPQNKHYPISQAGVWVECVRQKKVMVHNDYEALPDKKGLPEGHPNVNSELTVPVFRDNRIVAVMGLGNKPRPYDETDERTVVRIAGIAHDFVERKLVEQHIQFMAFNDSLTGLPNKELLKDRLKQATSNTKRTNRLLAVCYLDLDGFKPVNDQFGHHAGDALLVGMANRLTQDLRGGDTLARLGGDEFVLLLNGLNGVIDSESILKRILKSVSEPFDIEGAQISVTASIGVTFYPVDNSDDDTLLRHADKAMYKAKEAGRSVYRFFDPVQEQDIKARLKLAKELRTGLKDQQLELYYQPRIELGSGTVASVEALLRWNHPQQGMLLPSRFLPLIHNQPLELELGEWVLRQAIEQHVTWRDQGLILPVSVNISPRQLTQPDFPALLQGLLEKYPTNVADHLELEVLESTTDSDIQLTTGNMRTCAQLGVAFALDDFGTGYATLKRFHDLPVDILKIDKEFIINLMTQERDLDIVEGILKLANDLKHPVVAEGVESLEAGIMLHLLGCQFAQGFSISPPLPANQIFAWIRNWSLPNVWHDIDSRIRELPVPPDLGASIFLHQHWLSQFIQAIEMQQPDQLPTLDGEGCRFNDWYHGIGQARYGHHPSYPFILPKHSLVHKVADTIASELKDKNFNPSGETLKPLMDASENLIQSLLNLQAKGKPNNSYR